MRRVNRCDTPKALPVDSGSFFTGERGFRLFMDVTEFLETKIGEHRSRIFQTRILLKPTVIAVSNSAVASLLADDGEEYELGYDDYFKRLFGDTLFFVEGPEAKLLRESMRPLFAESHRLADRTWVCASQHCGCDASPECVALRLVLLYGLKRVIFGCPRLSHGIRVSRPVVPAESLLHSYEEKFRERLSRPVAELSRLRRVNVYKYFKAQCMALCLDVFLGSSPNGDPSHFKDEIASLITTHWHGILSIPLDFKFPMLMSTSYRKAVDARERLVKLITRRLRESDDGFLGCLKSTRLSEELQVQFLLLAVSALIPKAFASLMTSFFYSSEHWMALVDDDGAISDEYLGNVLLEVFRLYPPFLGGRRVAKCNTTLDGFSIPKGMPLVYINVGAHTDPSVFPDPQCFRPFRWKHENSGDRAKLFTFGSGSRRCIGHGLIFSGLKMICRMLVSEYTWEVENTAAVKLKYLPVLRPKEPLYVRFRRR